MTINETTVDFIADYLRIPQGCVSDKDRFLILAEKASAIEYIKKYTGRCEEYVCDRADIFLAFLVLVQDMYDTRSLYVESANVNPTVMSILDMHSVNLI